MLGSRKQLLVGETLTHFLTGVSLSGSLYGYLTMAEAGSWCWNVPDGQNPSFPTSPPDPPPLHHLLAPGLGSLKWRAVTGIGTPSWSTTRFFHSAFSKSVPLSPENLDGLASSFNPWKTQQSLLSAERQLQSPLQATGARSKPSSWGSSPSLRLTVTLYLG